MTLKCRLLPDTIASGAWNMAADEAMLQSAANGLPTLRFYAWESPTVSLGYFQTANPCLAHGHLKDLGVVRRASGGATLVHHLELTYSLALPGDTCWLDSNSRGDAWIGKMHQTIAAALATFGVKVEACPRDGEVRKGDVLCFLHQTPEDLLLKDNKILGSAQRKQRNALLQHGGILLRQSPYTPELPGIAELSGIDLDPALLARAIQKEIEERFDWQLIPSDWTESEREAISGLISTRYSHPAWTFKR